ncbi:T9SS type A sorting domain-containing protein [Fluviicola sp.]|uniref:T9SS type A sorting domain-containing protein n=1 Tax=Fluviicola sp. TaxID=1917219 RepID=UPI0031D2DEB6
MKSPLQWLVVASVTMVSGISFSQTRYVSATGSDASNDCQTPGSPCGTIQHAYSQALADDTIKIAPGNYNLTSTLSLLQPVVITALDPSNRPVLTTTASDVISVGAANVTISHLQLNMGLTAANGLRGIVGTADYDGLNVHHNQFISTKAVSTGMVFGAYAVDLTAPVGDSYSVTLDNNTVATAGPVGYDIFGRGFGLGKGATDGPSGEVSNNTILAYYAMQAVRNTANLTVSDNILMGITMVNYPILGAQIHLNNNTFTGVAAALADNLYAILDIRAIEEGAVFVEGNTISNYTNIGLLSMASKNVNVSGNNFNPLTTANNFISLMANTKLMTNGVQGNTFSDEISIKGNTFNAGVAGTGKAIVFADHYGANTPAFANITIGGETVSDKNVFVASLGNYIVLDELSGASTSYPLWAPYTATTMVPFDQDVNAYAVYNTYNQADFASVDAKNYQQLNNPVLGTVNLSPAGNIRYVSATGSDDLNTCTLPGSPCLTLAHAISVAAIGDSVLVAPGNYAQTSILTITQHDLTLAAQDLNDKPVLTTNQSTMIDINAEGVHIDGFRLELGLTATTGKYGIISTSNTFDSLSLTNNEIVSTSPIIPYGMVWDAFAVRLNANTGENTSVNIQNNVIGEAVAGTNNIFGRGISLGSAIFDGPGGVIANNEIMAYYTVQAIRSQNELAVNNNDFAGIMMVNTPLSDIHVHNNNFDGQTPMSMDSLYALAELRSVENASVMLENNVFTNYTRIALLSEASKNVVVNANEFNPSTTATAFVSVMANTKLMTNGVQGNTYADEIEITANDFHAGTAGVGTAIVFADHYGANTPAFGTITIGGTTAAAKNTFDTDLGSFIALDELTGASTSFPLWAPYPATTMVPVSQDVVALAIENNYGLADFAAIEAKNHDELENAALGKVIIKAAGDNRYVANTGVDVSNDCTLPGNPCATIAQAISVAAVNDTVFVAGGAYPQTSVLNVNVDGLTILAQDITDKPVITTNQPTVFDIDGTDVSIYGMRMELGLTATTGKYGIVSTTSNFDGAVIQKNEIVSTSPVIPYGMVWDAFAIRLNAPASTSTFVAILDNTIGTATPAGNNIFGRGISLGSGSSDGPGGTVISNDVKAYYTIQAIRTNQDMNIANNNFSGIAMLNAPLTGTDIQFSSNDVDAVTPMTADSLYALIDVRAIENGTVSIVDNHLTNYTRIGLLSMASKNVSVINNQFTPEASAAAFTSVMANTKLMTNGVQGNTYSDEISLKGNTFDAGAANGGTAIVFADHYGVNTPAFAAVTIGGTAASEKNTFNASLGNYIVLDDKTGTSAAVSLWAPYSVTTMKPFTQDVEALYIHNTYNLPNVASVELKNTDSVDNTILGKVILAYTFLGLDEAVTVEAKLYPNPAISNLTIELTDNVAIAELTVVDLSGKVVYTSTITGSETIDVSNLTSGVYVVRLNNNGQVSSTRFVKK